MKPIFVALALLLAPCVALAQSDQDRKSCDSEDVDLAIPACTRLIEAGGLAVEDRAVAYDSRGVAYWRKRDYDQAIANYDKAIELDPKFARAYMRRGASY